MPTCFIPPFLFVCLFVFLFFFFTAALAAYESFRARGGIRDTPASLCHSHCNSGSEPHL